MSFIESQVVMSQRSKSAYRWKMKDKMLPLSIFFTAIKHTVLSHLFVLPSMRTLQHDLQKMNIKPEFSESVFEALTVMNERDCNVSLVFNEMSIKQALLYNEKCNTIEGFEDFGFIGKTKYIANHAIAFVVRGLAFK